MEILVEHADGFADLQDKLSGRSLDFVAVYGNVLALGDGSSSMLNCAALHGATSCLGAMTHAGYTQGLAAFAISDPAGAYGTAVQAFNGDAREAARVATQQALISADRMGEQPDLIWLSATPGREEDVLAGIEAVVGRDVPIVGGSAADNSVEGHWFIFDGTQRAQEGVVVSVFFPSVPVSLAYQNGYSPTSYRGVITRSDGRKVLEINGRPALDVYSEWTGGEIACTENTQDTKAILSESTFWPLGREVNQLGNVPFYLLAHPAVAHSDGSMDLFATVETGEEVVLMTGTQKGLVTRAGRVAKVAREAGGLADKPVLGALMIYCGGCMLSVQDQLDDVVAGVNEALGDAPFVGAYTFGEQGALVRAGNRHGNLMISCVVFG